MTTFSEANQAKLSLKMLLHFYAFFDSAAVISSNGDYEVMVLVRGLNDQIRKIVPNIHKGCSVQISQAK